MAWTLQQTTEILDFIVQDRHFPARHLVLFHGLRRGELAALAWDEVDLVEEIIHISEQLMSISYEVHEDDPGLPPIRLHDGRHEAASLALAAGVAPKAVQAMLGHASMRMTTDTCQTVLPETHAATASASLDLLTSYREKEKKAAKKAKKKAKKKTKGQPHEAA